MKDLEIQSSRLIFASPLDSNYIGRAKNFKIVCPAAAEFMKCMQNFVINIAMRLAK